MDTFTRIRSQTLCTVLALALLTAGAWAEEVKRSLSNDLNAGGNKQEQKAQSQSEGDAPQVSLSDSSNSTAYVRLGLLRYKSKQYQEALGDFQKAISLNPTNATAYSGLGACHYQLGDYEKAAHWYRKCASLDPHNFNACLRLGLCLYDFKSYESAAETFQKAIQIKPDNLDAHILLGNCFFKSKSYQQAVNAYQKAYELNKKHPVVRYHLFWAYLMTSQFKKALEVYPIHHAILTGAVTTLSDLIGYGAAVVTPLVLFSLGTALLLKKSFKVSTIATPGLGFAIGWILMYNLGEFACAFVAGVFGWTSESQSAVVGMVIAPIPLLIAAMAAFPNQTWGTPFARPRSFPWKWVGVACLVLILILLVGPLFTKLTAGIAHMPFPHAHANTFFKEVLRGHHPALAVLVAVILGPMAEEVLFRGLLFGALQKWLSTGWTILTTAIVFAAWHIDFLYFVPLFAMGLLFGWVRNKTGSVWISAVVHALTSALILAALALRLHLRN